MSDLEALEAVTALGLTSDDIEDLVDKLSAFSVMTFSPVIACEVLLLLAFPKFRPMRHLTSAALAENEIVWAEKLTEGTGSNSVHGTGFEIDEDSTGDIFVARCLEQELAGRRKGKARVRVPR